MESTRFLNLKRFFYELGKGDLEAWYDLAYILAIPVVAIVYYILHKRKKKAEKEAEEL